MILKRRLRLLLKASAELLHGLKRLLEIYRRHLTAEQIAAALLTARPLACASADGACLTLFRRHWAFSCKSRIFVALTELMHNSLCGSIPCVERLNNQVTRERLSCFFSLRTRREFRGLHKTGHPAREVAALFEIARAGNVEPNHVHQPARTNFRTVSRSTTALRASSLAGFGQGGPDRGRRRRGMTFDAGLTSSSNRIIEN